MKNIRDYMEKLWGLKISTSLIKFDKEVGYKKWYSNPIEVTNGIIEFIDFKDYDFLVINLDKSGLVCLDIEGHADSVSDFYEFLDKNRIAISSLCVEKSMNDGLHIYFRNDRHIPNTSWNEMGNIHYDILTKRAFTSPSAFNEKYYEWIHNPFADMKTTDDIPVVPRFMIQLLENKEKYFTPKS